jgi:Putative peptidoglycan binding domain
VAHDYRPAHEYRPAPMSLAQRAAWRAQQPRALRQPRRRQVYPVVILLVLLAAVVVAAGGFEYVYRDRVYPRVQVSGVDVGGQTQAAVITHLQRYSEARLFRTVVLFAPQRDPILVAAHQLGYHLDRGTTARRAYNVGHGGSLLHRVVAQVNVLLHGAEVPVAQTIDQSALRHYLATLARVVNRKPRPGVAGRALDVAAAQRSITSLLLSPAGPFRVHLPFIRVRALPRPKVVHHPRQRAKGHHAATH